MDVIGSDSLVGELELVQIVLDTYKVKEGEIDLNFENISVKKLLTEISNDMEAILQKNNNKLILNIKYVQSSIYT